MEPEIASAAANFQAVYKSCPKLRELIIDLDRKAQPNVFASIVQSSRLVQVDNNSGQHYSIQNSLQNLSSLRKLVVHTQ